MRYKKSEPHFVWSVNCTQVTWPSWWRHKFKSYVTLTYLTKLKSILHIELEIQNLVFIFYPICKLYHVTWLPWWCHGCNSFVTLKYLTKFQINIVAVEHEIEYLFLILFQVCKLYLSHVTRMMTPAKIIFCQEV